MGSKCSKSGFQAMVLECQISPWDRPAISRGGLLCWSIPLADMSTVRPARTGLSSTNTEPRFWGANAPSGALTVFSTYGGSRQTVEAVSGATVNAFLTVRSPLYAGSISRQLV